MQIRWITIFFDLPAAAFDTGAGFWAEMTGTTLSERRGAEAEFATLRPSAGDAYLRVQRLQRISDGAGCHLDLHVDAAAMDGAVAAASALGATLRRREPRLAVLDSPGGFAFCFVPWEGEAAVPEPVRFTPGGASRVDTLCIDAPSTAFESECSFWAALTGWKLRAAGVPGYSRLERPSGSPVRLLFQRRDDAEPQARVSGHVDLGADDVDHLLERHVLGGAQVLAEFPDWVTLTDPAGHPYCLIRQSPWDR